MHSITELLKRVPAHWRLAPIHRRGQYNSDGKTPLDASRYEDFDAERVLEKLKRSHAYSAAGAWLGPRSQGLIVVDIDREGGEDHIRRKHGQDALPRTFTVSSPRPGHRKYFYVVPAIYWDAGKSQTLASNDGYYEILWTGRQGIILGEHPQGGYYEWEVPIEEIAPAPQWLLDSVFNDTVFFKLPEKIVATSFSEDEAAQVIKNALSAIPNPNRGEPGEVGYEDWFKILCSVYDGLPTDRGLELFEEWASQSDKYVPGYAAERSWPYLKRQEGEDKPRRTLGHLIQELRDQGVDPVPPDLQGKVLLKNGGETPALNLDFDQVIEAMESIHLQPNAARITFDLATLSKAVKIPVQTLVRVYEQHLRFQAGSMPLSASAFVQRFDPDENHCLIPDLLAQGSVVLLTGDSGSGKSYFAYNIARAVAQGSRFKGFPSRKGVVLIFQSDENPLATSRRLVSMGLDAEDSVIFIQGWTFEQELSLRTYLERYHPSLVIIDSLSSSNLASGISENDPAYAAPLSRLTNDIIPNYGSTCIVLHHNNRQGEFRGTSAIKASVDELWSLRRPTAADIGIQPSCQTIIEITKSRMDLWGSWVATYDPDTKLYDPGPWARYNEPESDTDPENQPQTAGDRVRMWFEGRSDDTYYSIPELQTLYTFADLPLTTLKSAITNLVGRGVLEKQRLSYHNVRYRALVRKPLEESEEAAVVVVEASSAEDDQPTNEQIDAAMFSFED